MGNRFELQNKMKSKLEQVGLPFIEIECYGRQITVECKSMNTIEKWSSILSKFSKIRGIVETTKLNKVNKNTSLLPSRYKIYRIYAQI